MADAPEADNHISITICGDGGCGKSSITLRLVRSEWTDDYDPTIEDSYSVTRHIDGQTYQLSLTDTAGQEEYRGLWAASNLKSADGFLLVYDITKADSLAGLEQFVELIEMESEHRLEFAQSSLAGRGGAASARGGGHLGAAAAAAAAGAGSTKMPPIKIIAGNKCDLARVRQVTSAQGLEYARSRGCGFMETSAKNMVNIEETFALIVRRVIERRQQYHSGHSPTLVGGVGGSSANSEGGGNQSTKAASTTIQDGRSTPGLSTPYHLSEKERQRQQAQSFDQGLDDRDRQGGKGGGGFWQQLRCW